MNRATPKDLRNQMQIATALTKAGIWFVAMPVFDADDHAARVLEAAQRLEKMADTAEQQAS